MPAVIAATVEAGLVSSPGYFTPREAFAALEAGAHALKLFPAEAASPAVVKAQRAVLPPDVPLIVVGGVTPGQDGGLSGGRRGRLRPRRRALPARPEPGRYRRQGARLCRGCRWAGRMTIRIAIIGFGKIARDQHVPSIARRRTLRTGRCVDPAAAIPGSASRASRSSPQMLAGHARPARRGGDLHAADRAPCHREGSARGRAARPARKAAGSDARRDRGSRTDRPRAAAGRCSPAWHSAACRRQCPRPPRCWPDSRLWASRSAGGRMCANGIRARNGSGRRADSACSIRASMPCRSPPGSCPIRCSCARRPCLSPPTGSRRSPPPSPSRRRASRAEMDWRHAEGEEWTIRVTTQTARLVELRDGGARLLVDGVEQAVASRGEYPALYARFAELVAGARERGRPRAAADRRRRLPGRAARDGRAVRMSPAWTRAGNGN